MNNKLSIKGIIAAFILITFPLSAAAIETLLTPSEGPATIKSKTVSAAASKNKIKKLQSEKKNITKQAPPKSTGGAGKVNVQDLNIN
ncbi:hypothetical protein WN093_04390 [Gammaproteobacteria bacterium AS21]